MQRYFITSEATYEILRQGLNTTLGYPNNLGQSIFHTPLQAPRDSFRRVLLAVETDIAGYATINAAITPLLSGNAMEELDEATYLAALASAGAGGVSSWNDLTDKPSTFPPSSHQHVIGDVTGLQTALDSKQATGNYSTVGHTHSALTDITGLAAIATSGSASDLGAGTVPTARLGSGTANSTTFLRGDSTFASPVTSLNGNTGAVTLPVLYEFTRTTAPAGATGGSGSWTFTLPSNCTYVRFECIASGSGGGSGRRGAAGSNRFGGGGGGGGGRGDVTFTAAVLTSRTVLVTVGAGGAGGAARTTDDTDGNSGTSGSPSSVRYSANGALNNNLCMASAGGGGGGGTAAAGAAGNSSFAQFGNTSGGASSVSAAGANALESQSAGTGGGGGGGIDTANTARNGGGGGRISPFSNTNFGSTGGTAPGGNGGDPFIYGYIGHGGAGGAGHASGTGGNGSTGAFPGGGGGGGGASVNGNNSGAGGNGGDGIVRIYCY